MSQEEKEERGAEKRTLDIPETQRRETVKLRPVRSDSEVEDDRRPFARRTARARMRRSVVGDGGFVCRREKGRQVSEKEERKARTVRESEVVLQQLD